MIKPFLTKLKVIFRRLLGKCVYGYVYLKNSLQSLLNTPQTDTRHHRRKHKKSILNIISAILKSWKLSCLFFLGFFILYYGIGATISAQLKKPLTTDLTLSAKSIRHTPLALTYVLKTQLDDSPWAPALPIIFPASILDNLPNFQLGVKDSAKYIVRRTAAISNNISLKEAGDLLNYPADIWLFSQTIDGKLAPGSAKQYRKALALITEYNSEKENFSNAGTTELLYQLKSLENILNHQVNIIHKHYQEHHNDFWDMKADNIFYRAQGNIFTVYYVLNALTKDYQHIIISSEQYENITTALNYLQEAEKLSPLIIKNGSTSDLFTSNHLLYLAYYISRAENYIQTITTNLKQYTKE